MHNGSGGRTRRARRCPAASRARRVVVHAVPAPYTRWRWSRSSAAGSPRPGRRTGTGSVLRRLGDRLGQLCGAAAAVGEVGADRDPRARVPRDLLDRPVLGGMVAGEGVDGDHRGYAVQPDVVDLLAQVGRPGEDVVGILGEQVLRQGPAGHDRVLAGMGLQRTNRGHHDGGVRDEAGRPALDVEEPLGTHVRAEPRLGDEEVPAVDADQVGEDRGVAVRDVPERSRVHEHRRVLQCLQQVGLDRVAQDRGHRAGGLQVGGADRIAAAGVPDDDPLQPGLEVGQRCGQASDRHHLGWPRCDRTRPAAGRRPAGCPDPR